MNWDQYCLEFKKRAKECGKTDEYCKKWLDYAYKLNVQGLPIIYTQEHLGYLVGYKMEYLYAASNAPRYFYRHYKIPKKAGGYREISEPLPNLKEIQRWILENILIHLDSSVYAKAYIKHKSIKDNARFHRKQKVLLTLDIKSFFDSISSDKVYDVFKGLGYADDVVVLLTNLCCLNGCLPQGAPTSPMLSNIILFDFDCAVGLYTKEQKIRYTRYADDMTFSGEFSPGKIISFVKRNLNPLGLKLNEEKIRVRRQNQCQEVTGIVVNQKMQLPKKIRKEIRQELFYIQKYGLESHMDYAQIKQENYLLHLKGIIQHGLFINPHDEELRGYLQSLNELS